MAVKRLKARSYTAIGTVYRPQYATTSAGFEPEIPVYTGDAATMYGTNALNLTYGSVQDIPKNNVSNISIVYRACSTTGGSGAGTIKLINSDTGIYADSITLSRQSDYNNWMHVAGNYVKYDLPSGVWDLILNGNWYIQVMGASSNSSFFTIICVDIEYEEPTDFKIGINKLKKAFLGSTAIQKIYKGVQLLYDSASVLPAEYQEVEYIGFDGSNSGQSTSAYFDTGIVPSATKAFYIDMDTMGASGCTGWGTGADSAATIFRGSNDGLRIQADGSNAAKTYNVVGRHVWAIDYYKQLMGYDNNLESISVSSYALINFYLGAWHEGNTQYYGINGRVYGFKAYDNDSLIADYIPCYRKSDGVIGFYDAVTETFKTKSGNGSVSKGLDIGWTLPTEYQRVEYIQASGDIYINANYSARDNSTFYLDYIDEQDHSDVAYANYFYTSYYRFIRYPNLNYAVLENRTGSGSMSIVHVPSATYNTRHQLEFARDRVKDGDGINYVIYPSLTGNYGYSNNLILFRGYYWNNWDNYGYYKLYNFRVYEDDGGTLVRNYVPCYRKSDNVIGLYETRQGVFYTGIGTGSFTKGPDV